MQTAALISYSETSHPWWSNNKKFVC